MVVHVLQIPWRQHIQVRCVCLASTTPFSVRTKISVRCHRYERYFTGVEVHAEPWYGLNEMGFGQSSEVDLTKMTQSSSRHSSSLPRTHPGLAHSPASTTLAEPCEGGGDRAQDPSSAQGIV